MTTTSVLLLLTPLVAFAVTAGLMPLVNLLALKTGFVDMPNARKIHLRPVPLLGGLGVYVGVVLALACLAPLDQRVVLMMLASLIVMIIGVVDDRMDLHSRYRLMLQILVAAGLAACGVRFSIFLSPIPDGIITVIWMVGVINAINCMDCADGAAGATCLVVFAAVAVIAEASGRHFISQAALAGAGAVLGFLVYNAPPARVFLGDTGSTFLGLMLAALTVLAQPQAKTPLEVPMAPFFLLVPVLDIIWVHARRYNAGIRSFRDLMASTGKDHLPHRLLARGMSQATLFWSLLCLSMLASLAAIGAALGLYWVAVVCLGLLILAALRIENGGVVRLRPEDSVALFHVHRLTESAATAVTAAPHVEKTLG